MVGNHRAMSRRVIGLLEAVSTWAARIGGLAIAFSALLITIDVIMRKFFGSSLGAMDEVTGYIFIIATSWSFAFALIKRNHIRIDTLYVWLPAKMQVGLDLVCMSVMAALSSTVLWYAWFSVSETVRMGSIASTPLRTPLAIPQIPWLGGLVFFAVTAVSMLVVLLGFLFRGRLDLIRRYGGAPSLNEEVEEVIEEAAEHTGEPIVTPSQDRRNG
jgi:TRAP-type C4-dicarboxylate transport system permease small subunit